MTRRQQDPRRPLTPEERAALEALSRAQSEPASHVARARLVLAVADGRRSGDAVAKLVARCNTAGLAAIVPGHGRGAPAGLPAHQPHEYVRTGPAKLLTLLHPARGQVRVKGVTRGTNAVRHPWLREELAMVLADLPPLRVLLVLDNLAGHLTPAFVLWLFAHGIMPLSTPLGGSWLNLAASIQRVLKRRALDGAHPATPAAITAALEATARGWNRDPTPCGWGGQRAARRERARQRRQGGTMAIGYAPRAGRA